MKIANGFSNNGVIAKSASAIAQTIGEAYDEAEKDMADLKIVS